MAVDISNIDVTENNKLDVVLAIMNSIRNHITDWHSRAYTSTTWSVGLMLGIGAYSLNRNINGGGLDVLARIFFASGISFFLVLGQIYLHNIENALKDNGRVLVRCEAALRLNEPGKYLIDNTFFEASKSGDWVFPKDISFLYKFHRFIGIAIILSVLIIS